jgi:hypothetical protein
LPFIVVPAVALALYLAVANLAGWQKARETEPIADTVPKASFDAEALRDVTTLVQRAAGHGEATKVQPISPRLDEPNHGIYVALRANGEEHASGWRDDGTVASALQGLVGDLLERRPGTPDAAEICVAHSFRDVEGNRRGALSNVHRGIRGLEIDSADGPLRFSPTTMLARNLDFDKALRELARRQKSEVSDLDEGHIRTFECDQILVAIDRGEAFVMERGNQLVPLASVDRESTRQLNAMMADWLLSHLHADGRMTYKWWPSRGEESSANNMIRQWMASVALVRHAVEKGDPLLHEHAARNIDYNLSQFYREEAGGRGFILFRGKAKLGAAALAAMAIMLHPERARWSRFETNLLNTVLHLQDESGHFRTFLHPQGREDNQNFYPGEALYYLALRYNKDKEPALVERIMRGMRYYKRWHLENRNPAFIPWHTQAYFALWKETRDEELAEWIFEMNDWLLGVQQWDSAEYPDTQGRFYDPKRRRFGPPHASSTGVYLEGLADAFVLARELGDDARMAAYRRAIVRGIRSIMQLQFVDEIDMFYINKRTQSRGGVRTRVYDNVIRVDNVQHAFMGIQKILAEMTDEDFAQGAR